MDKDKLLNELDLLFEEENKIGETVDFTPLNKPTLNLTKTIILKLNKNLPNPEIVIDNGTMYLTWYKDINNFISLLLYKNLVEEHLPEIEIWGMCGDRRITINIILNLKDPFYTQQKILDDMELKLVSIISNLNLEE